MNIKKLLTTLILFISVFFIKAQVSNLGNWMITGNSIATNTNYIGTKTNRSLLFRTNNVQRLKLDSVGTLINFGPSLTWTNTSSGYTNNISLTAYSSFTDIPAMYVAVSPNAYSGSNYAILGDGVNNVFNAPRGFFARSGNVNLMNCNATNTTSGYYIEFNGISQPTVTAANHGSARFNSNILGFEAGTFAQNNNVAIAADSYSSNGATTITDAVGLDLRQPTAGTGMTITRAWALSAVGNANISSRLKVGNVITAQDPTTATLVVIGTASVSSTSTLTGIRNNATFTTTGAAMIGGTTAGSATLHVLGTASVSGSSTLTGVRNNGTVSCTGNFSTTARVQFNQGASVASTAGAMTLGGDGNTFEITGTNAITAIVNTSWQNGSEITLFFTSTASLTDGTVNSGANIGFELAGNVNFNATADDALTLVLCTVGGVQRWREKCRSVN